MASTKSKTKLVWGKFFFQDFIIGVQCAGFTDEEIGKYIQLLCWQFISGGYLTEEKFKSIIGDSSKVKSKFLFDKKNGFYNERMLEVVKESTQKIETNKLNGKKGGEANAKANASANGEASGLIRASTSLSSSYSSSLEKGGVGENQFPPETGVQTFNVEETVLANQKWFEAICMKTGYKSEAAKKSLRKFHLHLEEKNKYPMPKKSAFAGFEKWLMNEERFTVKPEKKPEPQGPQYRPL